MTYNTHIPLKTFKEVSVGDKAKAITMFGTLLATTSAYGMNFFLYAIDNYFVEVTSRPGTGDVVYIRATDRVGVLDLYLDNIGLSDILE
ncbi:MAG TPA: hypothetical protein VK508_10895 [Cyclobacteriaceae bacterium]|nr:hypothetical protein [Cyclobacteriaceae bacterium]